MSVHIQPILDAVRALRPATQPTARQVLNIQKKITALYNAHLSNGRFDTLSAEQQNELATACEITRWQRAAV